MPWRTIQLASSPPFVAWMVGVALMAGQGRDRALTIGRLSLMCNR